MERSIRSKGRIISLVCLIIPHEILQTADALVEISARISDRFVYKSVVGPEFSPEFGLQSRKLNESSAGINGKGLPRFLFPRIRACPPDDAVTSKTDCYVTLRRSDHYVRSRSAMCQTRLYERVYFLLTKYYRTFPVLKKKNLKGDDARKRFESIIMRNHCY